MEFYSRRRFLKMTAIWAGGAWVIGVPSAEARRYNTLTEEEAGIMDLIADAIIPPDDLFVGGKEAMVTRFLDRQLGRHGYLQRERERYRICLPAINQSAIEEFGTPFIQLEEPERTTHLKNIEAGRHDTVPRASYWQQQSPSAFFRLVRDHCMMGFYGSPQHGGNKESVSFRMLGLL